MYKIANQIVKAIIHQEQEHWTPDSVVYSFYLLENGALVSRDARVNQTVSIGFGSIIEAGCQIKGGVRIGDMVRIGDGTTIDVGVKIGDYTTIRPECEIGQNSEIGQWCDIGTLNNFNPHTKLGSGTVIPNETVDETTNWDFEGASDGCIAIVRKDWTLKIHYLPEQDDIS